MRQTIHALIVIGIIAVSFNADNIVKWYKSTEARLDREYDSGREPLESDFIVNVEPAWDRHEFCGFIDKPYEVVMICHEGRIIYDKLHPKVKMENSPKQNFVPKSRRGK